MLSHSAIFFIFVLLFRACIASIRVRVIVTITLVDLLVGSLLSFSSLLLLYLLKHLKDFLEESRDSSWVFDSVRSVVDSQDAGDANHETLLLVGALEALLALGQLNDD